MTLLQSPATVARAPALQDFLFIDISETDESLASWADAAEGAHGADIVAVPQDDGGDRRYPSGAQAFLERLRAALPPAVTVSRLEGFVEAGAPAPFDIFPKLLVSAQAWPALQSVFETRLEALVGVDSPGGRIEASIVIVSEAGRAILVRYGGGPKGFQQTVTGTAPHFLPAIQRPRAPERS